MGNSQPPIFYIFTHSSPMVFVSYQLNSAIERGQNQIQGNHTPCPLWKEVDTHTQIAFVEQLRKGAGLGKHWPWRDPRPIVSCTSWKFFVSVDGQGRGGEDRARQASEDRESYPRRGFLPNTPHAQHDMRGIGQKTPLWWCWCF